MFKSLWYFLSAASLASTVLAHGRWRAMWVNDIDFGSYCVRDGTNVDYRYWDDPDLACKDQVSKPAQNLCAVKPGDEVTLEYHLVPRTCTFSNSFVRDHPGPVSIYMAKVTDAKTALGANADWFKVWELGLVATKPKPLWADDIGRDNCGRLTFTVPDIAPGQYLIRGEVIALHFATDTGPNGGAQVFPGCFQLEVGGNGTARPPTVKIPGAYHAQDPGIFFDVKSVESGAVSEYIGPRPYGYTAPPVITTPYTYTATVNTDTLPRTVPTAPVGAPPVPEAPTTPGSPLPSSPAAPAGPQQTRYGQCGG
ncbi:hypothetical protein CC1G_09949 [Coprinopsis cinerea okayama7|uniref:AA9 family lytic polysaccharide monooxygenase n=1 Tax=Coprinopsis cinerea (strain Okayama-7 / 130 / ATCC MYA-4618 / FGSC 9003) TaxID=240176 RepID=A8PGQ9_COPC7|nr:hypothetical protein CC1G_09949 [Coprinopsis cinerea okayama7\|eukprot:XP_001841257.2 hypothetical protein CC1G_09949 [Coprinopsis cinerea okayama7\